MVNKLLSLTFCIAFISLLFIGCKEDNLCEFVTCKNGGSTVELEDSCVCDCPKGYLGIDCGNVDLNEIQNLLSEGTSPFDLLQNGLPIDSLYGKIFEEGLIFYLDVDNQIGMVAALEDQSLNAEWGCYGMSIPNLNSVTHCTPPVGSFSDIEGSEIGDGLPNTNSIVAVCTQQGAGANLCRSLGEDWFLPARLELGGMYRRLSSNGIGDFQDSYYWSSTQNTIHSACVMQMGSGTSQSFGKGNTNNVRAAKTF